MKVRFLKDWLGYKSGKIVTFKANESIVAMLIDKGIVEPLALNTLIKDYNTK